MTRHKYIGTRHIGLIFFVSMFLCAATLSGGTLVLKPRARQMPPSLVNLAGQTSTLLPDGRLLLTGGEDTNGPVSIVLLKDPQAGITLKLTSGLVHPRAWHTAALLPNGTVLISGGIGANGAVESTAELFDPSTQIFVNLPSGGLTARARHTATVLTDGRLLIVGGVATDGQTLATVQLWDYRSTSAVTLSAQLHSTRKDQIAVLQANGKVLISGGTDQFGAKIDLAEVYDPASESFSTVSSGQSGTDSSSAPSLVESVPTNGEGNVSSATVVALRFSRPLNVTTLNSDTVVLSDSGRSIAEKVTPVESGMLAFVTPSTPLSLSKLYTVTISGAKDLNGASLPGTEISFTTASPTLTAPIQSASAVPTFNPVMPSQGLSLGGQTQSPFQSLPPLQARNGETALAGQALTADGMPLEDVTLSIGTVQTRTDRTGRFLLTDLPSGHQVLLVDGTSASTGNREFGIFEVGVEVIAGKTTPIGYTMWMTQLDTNHVSKISSPTKVDTVLSTPLLPGLELHIPAGTVIRDHNGKVVKEISITPVSVKQPPFPLPNVPVPIYFTIQPGAAYLEDASGNKWAKGAQLYYPNSFHYKPGTRFDFWNYDADSKGWFIYGQGTVSPDGSQVIPDPAVKIYEFTGAMVGGPGLAPPTGPRPGPKATDGDPVDLGTGLFNYEKTDLTLSDIIPVALTRTYRPGDTVSRAFGIGASHPYDIFLIGDTFPYTYMELVLQDGGKIRYNRISSGTSFTDAVYIHSSTATQYYGSIIAYNSSNDTWVLTFKDGTVYVFPDSYLGTTPQQGALIAIVDRYGNTVNVARDSNHNLTQITTPSGRWIQFTYDTSNRVTQAKDNIGRTIAYTYDTGGRLSSVTDANGGVWNYTYDSSNQMLTIEDPRGITYLTNQYDTNGRVTQQTQADGTTYQFAYTLTSATSQTHLVVMGPGYTGGGPGAAIMSFRSCSGCGEGYSAEISKVDVTDPRGYIREVLFGSNGYMTSDTRAKGQAEQTTTTYQYFPDNLLQSVTDPLGRTTSYVYDVNDNTTQVTQLTGTSSATTTILTYTTAFNEVASVTDPLSHTTNFAYDSSGSLTSVTDPLSHQTSFTYNSLGQTLTGTDPLGNTTQFQYHGAVGDLVAVTDSLSRKITRQIDNAGRVVSITNPLGQTTSYTYNVLNQPLSVSDPLGGSTTMTYDANGNLSNVTDANAHSTSYTYSNMDRLATRTDPLLNTESYAYDATGNLSAFTDRRGKATSYQYDGLRRRIFAGFNMQTGPTYDSTISYAYDAGNRLIQTVDSVAGTFSRGYDGMDRLTSETSPQGVLSYSYDAAGRRATQQVTGQSQITYSYDNANRLTGITQGTVSVSFGYDNENRRTSLTLPNGVVVSYSFDAGSQLTAVSYALGTTSLGNLTYGYDPTGRRTSVGGSLAVANLPNAITTSAYNAANQLTTWGTASLYYDANGNMTSDGTNGFVWDARNHLASMNFSANSFQYDPYGRRQSKTISSTTTKYLYDGVNVVQELAGTTPTANLLDGGTDEIFTRTDSSGTVNLLSDALGSALALTDGSGSTVASYAYEPFGNTTQTGMSTNPFQYAGRENDGTGIYFYRARYYNPMLQRFISEDPMGLLGGSTNLYPYVSNDPIYLTDPSGRCPMCIVAIAGGIIGGAYAGYEAYENGARGWNVVAATAGGAGTGMLVGLTGGVVGGWAATELGLGGVAAGTLGGAAGGGAEGFLDNAIKGSTGGEANFGEIPGDMATGALTGFGGALLGEQLMPVRGGQNFDPMTSPRNWGPKAQQLYLEELIDKELASGLSLIHQAQCVAGRKCK